MEALNAVDYSRFVAFGTRSKLTQSAMMDITINLPPLAEQKRIVDVVSSVDAYIDALQQQVDMARAARNAVLHELLSAGGDDWTETTLGELCDVRDGTHDSPKQSQIGFPLVTSKNIRNGKVDVSDVYLISDSDFHEINKRSKVDQFDLLISMIGTVGEVCFEPNQPNYAIKNVGLIKTGNELLGRFLLGYLSSRIGQEQIELSTSGSTQKFIGLGKLRSLKISLPPLVVQKRIVGIVSSMDDVIQSTEQAVIDAKALRSGLLLDLLSGEHEIPASYDVFVGAA
jgi:type I restriction enzyme S subunit